MSDDPDGPPANARWLAGTRSGSGQKAAVLGSKLWVRPGMHHWSSVDLGQLASLSCSPWRGGDLWRLVDRGGHVVSLTSWHAKNRQVLTAMQPFLETAAGDDAVKIGWFTRRKLRVWGVRTRATRTD